VIAERSSLQVSCRINTRHMQYHFNFQGSYKSSQLKFHDFSLTFPATKADFLRLLARPI